MYLAPHHFQAQARFFESAVSFVRNCLLPFSFGFSAVEVDQLTLRGGLFGLHHISGVMPDGMPFELKTSEEMPTVREVSDLFPATGQPLLLYLAVTGDREGYPSISDPASGAVGHARYRAMKATLPDFNTGQGARPIKLLRPDLRLAVENELGENDVAMPVARVLRDGKGQYLLDETWVPPFLQVAGSRRLSFLLNRLLEILREKSRSLTATRRKGSGSDFRADPREHIEFWLLHSINAAIPVLSMWASGRSPHPSQLFRDLSRLAGALSTFASGSTTNDLPDYDHMNLGDCFGRLDAHIRDHLEITLPTNCLAVPLTPYLPAVGTSTGHNLAQTTGSAFFEGTITDPRCMEAARWILTVASDGPESTLITGGAQMIKVISADILGHIVAYQKSGVPLSYCQIPPPSVPSHPGDVHFSLDRNDRLFFAIRERRTIGVAIPGAIPNPRLQLHIVLDSPS